MDVVLIAGTVKDLELIILLLLVIHDLSSRKRKKGCIIVVPTETVRELNEQISGNERRRLPHLFKKIQTKQENQEVGLTSITILHKG